MDLSVLIVNWKTRELLRACLASLHAGRLPAASETLVVDNASGDGSAAMVRACFPQVRLIENSQNAGFARASNLALSKSSGRYLLLLNPDTEVSPGAVMKLMAFMAENRQAGAAGPLLLNPDGSFQLSAYKMPTLFRELWRLLHLDLLYPVEHYPQQRWSRIQPREVEVLNGACLILRREVLAGGQLFDEDYFMYSEEVDLCRRIRLAQWRLFWVPEARVKHHIGASTSQAATPMFLHLYRSKLLYFRKHNGPAAATAYKLILLLAALTRLLLSPLALFLRRPQREHYMALAGRYGRLVLALPRL